MLRRRLKGLSGSALTGAAAGAIVALAALALDPANPAARWPGLLAIVATGWLAGAARAWRAQERADVGEILRLREELRRSQGHIMDTATYHSLGAYLEITAHQLREPLDKVRARATTLAEDPALPERSRHTAAALREEVERLSTVLRHLAAFSLARPGRAPFNVNDLLRESVLLCRHRASEKGIRFEEIYADVPPVFGPASRIQGALAGVLINAVEAMPHGGGTITIETEHAGDRVISRIRDTGIGIRPEHLPKIFDPFFTTKPQKAGVGLGLWAVKQTLDLIGADISVRSALFQGTEMTIAFPQAAPIRPGRVDSVFPEEIGRNTAEELGRPVA